MEKAKEAQKTKSKKHFKLLTRVPWSDFQEWKNCYDFLFSNTYSASGKKLEKITETVELFIDRLDFCNLQKAFNVLNIWNSRTDNNTYILATLLLLEEIIKFISNSYLNFNINDKKHILSQKIIRVTNLIIDDLKKKNKNIASNMFLVAKEINLPEFIIEIRHICTHKALPDLNTLVFAIKYLYFWLKVNLWDKQFEYFLKESKSKEKVFEILNELEKENKEEKENKNSYTYNNFKIKLEGVEAIRSKGKNSAVVNVKFEINDLVEIVNALVQKFSKFCVFSNNGKVYNAKIKEFSLLLDFVYRIEGELLIVLLYKYISEFAFYEISLKIIQEAEKEENTFKFSANKVIEENKKILRKFKFLIFFIQKFLSNKDQFVGGSASGEFELESHEVAEGSSNSNKKVVKAKKEAKVNSNNEKNAFNKAENNSHFYPLLLNYVKDLLRFSQDFSFEIKEIYEMFCCNFKQHCEALNSNSSFNSISPIFFNEEALEKTLLDNERLRSNEQQNTYTDNNRYLTNSPSGALIFRQLDMISSGTLTQYFNYNKNNNSDDNFVFDYVDKNLNLNEEKYIDENEEADNYNFTYMDKRLRKILDKENKKKLLREQEEKEESLLKFTEDCFIIDLNFK